MITEINNSIVDDIEIHTDGTKWIACNAAHPFVNNERSIKVENENVTVYHPDAIIIAEDGSVGWDTQYRCPHCKKTWWVEIDG